MSAPIIKPSIAKLVRAARVPNALGAGKASDTRRQLTLNDCVFYWDLPDLDLPPEEYFLDPVLTEAGCLLLYGSTGQGKSILVNELAAAVATGGEIFEKWDAPKARNVLFIDGEMQPKKLKKRTDWIRSRIGRHGLEKNFYMLSKHLFVRDDFPDLGSVEGQWSIEKLVEWADLIVLDNLITLVELPEGVSSDKAESWTVMRQWVTLLEKRGKSVILVHHAGKSGDQLGSITKLFGADTVIKVTKKFGGVATSSIFKIEIEKGRDLTDAQQQSFEVKFEVECGEAHWSVEPAGEPRPAARRSTAKPPGRQARPRGADRDRVASHEEGPAMKKKSTVGF